MALPITVSQAYLDETDNERGWQRQGAIYRVVDEEGETTGWFFTPDGEGRFHYDTLAELKEDF